MKWAILLGSPKISGGTYVVFEHAIRAHRRGTEVSIITEDPVHQSDLHWHPEARELNWLTYSGAQAVQFDAAIATWWATAYHLPRISARTYCYFVQSIESRFYGDEDRHLQRFAEATYALPASVITESTWIRSYLHDRYGLRARLVHNGIRKDIYSPDGECVARRQPGRLRVLVEGAVHVPFKNVARTVELCRRSKADEVWLLSPTPIGQYDGIDRVFSGVPIRATPGIYRSCDVIVKLSYVEGMFGPPLEMFHCGGTAVVYDVTGHDEYIRHDQNALVCRTDDEAAVVAVLNRLKQDHALLDRLKRGAAETADAWSDWETSSRRFEAAVGEAVSQGECPREVLLRDTRLFMDWYTFRQTQQEQTIADQARMLEDRWAAMQKTESMICDRDETISDQARMIEERWAAMQRMESMIRERDKTISDQARMVEERWAAIQEMEGMIRERDRTIAEQAPFVAESGGASPGKSRRIVGFSWGALTGLLGKLIHRTRRLDQEKRSR